MKFECDRCGGIALPIWFLEEEETYPPYEKVYTKTGRVREAISHFSCTSCFKNFAVDGEYGAGNWYEKE